MDPHHRADEVQKTEVARRRFLVPRGDAAPPLDGMEEALDEVALLVEFLVIATFRLSRFARWYDRIDAPVLQFGDDPISVVGLVGENSVAMHVVDEFFGDGRVVLLSRGDKYMERPSLHVDCDVNLCGEAAS